jgi:hypothetical protein
VLNSSVSAEHSERKKENSRSNMRTFSVGRFQNFEELCPVLDCGIRRRFVSGGMFRATCFRRKKKSCSNTAIFWRKEKENKYFNISTSHHLFFLPILETIFYYAEKKKNETFFLRSASCYFSLLATQSFSLLFFLSQKKETNPKRMLKFEEGNSAQSIFLLHLAFLSFFLFFL